MRASAGLLVLLVAGAALFTGAALAVSTSADYDKSIDFSKYKSYSWGKGTPAANPLVDDRIRKAVDAQLQAKGWKLLTEGGDAVVASHVAVQDKTSVDTFYSGWDYGWGYYGGAGWGTTTVSTYKQGTLLVDIFDAEKKALAWRGRAEGTLPSKPTPEKSEKKIGAAVTKMFRKFPPAPPKS